MEVDFPVGDRKTDISQQTFVQEQQVWLFWNLTKSAGLLEYGFKGVSISGSLKASFKPQVQKFHLWYLCAVLAQSLQLREGSRLCLLSKIKQG